MMSVVNHLTKRYVIDCWMVSDVAAGSAVVAAVAVAVVVVVADTEDSAGSIFLDVAGVPTLSFSFDCKPTAAADVVDVVAVASQIDSLLDHSAVHCSCVWVTMRRQHALLLEWLKGKEKQRSRRKRSEMKKKKNIYGQALKILKKKSKSQKDAPSKSLFAELSTSLALRLLGDSCCCFKPCRCPTSSSTK